MKRIFIDIETLPTDEANREFVERKLRKNLARKNLVLSEADFLAESVKYFRNTALHGSLGRLLCVGVIVEENGKILHEGVFGANKDGVFHLEEQRTLQGFWNCLENSVKFDFEKDLIIGHNILGFDLPFLYQRSMVCGVKATKNFLNGKPWDIAETVYDTMDRWQLGKYYEKISLEELALAFGLNCPKSGAVNAESLLEAFWDARHDEIRAYCLDDVRCTRQLYYRMTEPNLPAFETQIKKEMALCA